MRSTFEVDKKGLAQLVRRRGGIHRAVEELISNAQDEDVTHIDVRFEHVRGRTYRIAVEDDSPEGFKDITHAYTLFAPSYKKSDPAKRGRFNFGEKWVIAICESARISTTSGTVIFKGNKRRRSREKRQGVPSSRGTSSAPTRSSRRSSRRFNGSSPMRASPSPSTASPSRHANQS